MELTKLIKFWALPNANSSSSHALLIVSQGNVPKEELETPFQYGWENFILTSKLSKSQYMAVVVHDNLMNAPKIDLEILEILNQLPLKSYNDLYELATTSNLNLDEINEIWATLDKNSHYDIYIDHQSMIRLPKNRYGQPHLEFIKTFYNHVVNNPSIVIRGGNDNDDELPEVDYDDDLSSKIAFESQYVLQDGEYWIAYDRVNGHKKTFTFNHNLKSEDYIPSFPYLVDLKITDYCNSKCEFCYQASTNKGRHAPLDYIKSVLDALHEHGVFEIALGGGEPTSHPQFIEILEYAYNLGFMTNFTTKSVDWVYNKENFDTIRKYVTAIAFSYDGKNFDNLVFLDTHFKGVRDNSTNLMIQVIPELLSTTELRFISLWCAKRYKVLTLLGYKFTGRGKNFEVSDLLVNEKTNVETLIKSDDFWKLSCDTALMQRYDFLTHNIPKTHYHTTEGQFSVYVDACAKVIGKSSYHLDTFKPFDVDKPDLKFI